MPAKSEAQRRYLFSHFGPAWVKKHGFDNSGPLPARIGKGGVASMLKRAKTHPKKHVRKPHHAAKSAAKGHIYQTAEHEGIARRALRRA